MRATKTVGLLVATLAIFGLGFPASAQTQMFGLNVEGDVEAGVRLFGEKPSKSRSAKFEEYRDLREGLFLERLELRLFRPDESYSTQLGGSKWGQQDQEFSLRAGRLGLWEFGFDWDQTPHIFSTNARMLATETSRGVFTLPTPRPSPLTLYNSARELDEISIRWDTARISLRLTPSPDLELKAEYTRITKDGDRPMSMGFGGPGGNFLEVLEPIEHTIHDFRLQAAIARERWQLQFGYALSAFQNAVTRLIADNPCLGLAAALPAGCGATDGGAAAPAQGRVSLPPNNMAHTFTAAGGVSLPLRTRITGNVSYSLRLQNDDFLPHTINPTLTGDPDLALAKPSLNGNVQVVLFNLNATSRPFRPLTLSAKYRFYDYMDLSDVMTFPGHVVNDRGPVVREARQPGRWDYTKHNTDVDGRLVIFQPLALTLGAGWERWDRNQHREVPESDEFFGKAAIDVTPFDWVLARLTYKPSFRRVNQYNSRAHAEHTVVDDPAAATQGQSVLLRKFDEGERDRQRVDLHLQLMPTEAFTATPTLGWRYDDYVSSPLGLQQETSWSAGIDLNWTPIERVSIFGGYMHEVIEQKMRSRSRPVNTVGGVGFAFDFADFDWVSVNADTVDTVHLGVKTALIPKVLDWTLGMNYSTATGRIETRNPVAPTSGTAAQNASAQAKPMPAFEDTLVRLETALSYHFLKSWTASLRYVYESFDKADWRTDQLNPFIPGITSIWLGNDLKDYTAHIMGLTLAYRFK